jgi:predicted phage terminase large subunit-like protein
MIFLPPRHGKSELVTVRYTAWRMIVDAKVNVILGSYNQRLANRFSRKVKRIVSTQREESAERQKDLPQSGEDAKDEKDGTTKRQETTRNKQTLKKQSLTQSVEEWETSGGGGLRAVGVGGGITGFGANLVVVDDPIKSRAEAESETFRENVWDWFNDDLYTRLEPNAAIILIQTRWHEDDLAGRLLREMEDGGEEWEFVKLPALAEGCCDAEIQGRGDAESESPASAGGFFEEAGTTKQHEITRKIKETENPRSAISDPQSTDSQSAIPNPRSADPLGRSEGEALCPARFDRKALLRIRAKLGSYGFSALYQQNPIPAGGGAFKREWFRAVVDSVPAGLRWARGYDLAVSTKTSADYTASFRCAFDRAGNLYIADGFRKRIEYPEQRRYVVERMKDEKDTRHGVEAALHGQALVQDLRRDPSIRFRPLRAVRVDGDKLTRALAWANLAEEGKVILVRGPWIADFLEEVCRFTGRNDRHDDQVDAVSLAVRLLSEKDKRLYGF